jgi:Golgi apparatus protein 1
MARADAGQAADRRRRLLGDASKDDKQKQQQQQQQQQQAAAGRKEQPGKAAEQAKAKAAPAAAAAKAKAAAAVNKPKSEARKVPRLSEQCYALAVIAEPPKSERTFDVQSAAYSMLTSSMEKLEASTGLPTLTRNRQGGVTAVSLTGWTALVGMASLVVVLLAGATLGVRQYLGHGRDGYTLVTKQAPPAL